jgi:hypothetical protein
MKKQSHIALFVLSLVAVLAASASIVGRVAYEESVGKKAARENFGRLSAILAPVRVASDLASPGIRADLARFYRESPNLLLVSVYERGSGVRWRIPARSEYLPAAENLSPIPQPAYPPQSAFLLAAALPADVTGKLAVDGLYVVLPQAKVFEAFRDASLGLAAFLLLLAFIVLGEAISDRRRRPEPASAETGTYSYDQPPLDECPEAAQNQACDESVYTPLADDDFDIPSIETEAPARAEAPLPLKTEKAAAASTEAGPGGLFSPLSGLGWESYLEHRLDAELARAASFEQDLSLLLIRYPGLSPERKEYRATAAAIAEFFNFKDLAFEHGQDGFAVILPNLDAEHGLRMAEEFQKKLNQLITGNREATRGPVLHMGLSSRAGRLVDSDRVSQEAQTALRKAATDAESHIMAFRPDPDRYRLFLASRGI